MEIKTLKDLKEFLGTLSEKQLTQKSALAVDDDYHYIRSASFNEERCVWHEDMEDGNIPVDCYHAEDFEGRPLDHEENIIFEIGDIVILSNI